MGVLNLIIERAPTSPSDNAREDLTTLIIKNVIVDMIINVFPIDWDLETCGKNLL